MKTLTQIALAFFLLSLIPTVEAQTQGPMLLESPTVSRTHVAFSFAGDIWLVERQGGEARRLTTH
jgi:tricorn protease